ncbi:restriction endonuclease subunit S [Clostridium perfringens]|uniref:restriction endonuclease subunit S n=1 Tax=Clostridium perfringens TaxID=1502 RepID=UPI0013E2884A|nr:restriction endonuclease subunit S [Clostridium perfringens]MBI6023341.1 restriction endonuclease subunit S [Clostridium perfringens]MBI6045361.1 restriction endonuclease subunit S [Clostridium perfringens]MBI6046916.1 restriction endonuclease subunit S [Clostridium perfringens]MDJ8925325.1 restriction endonuclease subunit S [Clostridium perfringens]MDJ8929238.1 restriction endonuclease subunit S [Clostridium perfringens]
MSKNVPELRFKGFEDEWKEKKISDTLKIRHGKDQKLVANDLGKYPILGTGGIIGKSNEFLYDKESVLIGRKGTIDRPFYMNTPFWTVDTLFYSEIKKGFCAKFLYYSFQRINWKKYSEASGVPSLSASTIESIKYILPELNEQEKITNFLSKVDSIIEKQEKKVEYWNSYKKGMMQKIFSQKIRFKDKKGRDYPEWEEKKLGDISVKLTEKNKNFEIKNVISNSAKNGLIEQNEIFDKDIANKNNIDGYYIIENGDFVYNPRKSKEAPYGPINMFKLDYKGIVSPLYLCFRINKVINKNYIEYYFKSFSWHRYIYHNSDQGVRHDRISIKDSEFMKIKINLPCLKEQDRIASFLLTIDNIIEKESKKLEELKQWKKGLLQQMFV